MKLPRDISGAQLAKKLAILGYHATRQTGGYIRLTTLENEQQHITVPAHDPLKVGTLSGILSEVAAHFGKAKEEIVAMIF